MTEKPRREDLKLIEGKAIADYIDDLANKMNIDLSKVNKEETARILNSLSTSISEDILEMRKRRKLVLNE